MGESRENNNYDFDVAVTFAGEDRTFVEQVVREVRNEGFQVFYDEDNQFEQWGEDLTEYFADVYERRARYAVMFISAAYAAKSWPRAERRSVLLRALNQNSAYLLPVRLDSTTTLPGVRGTVGHLDGLKLGASGIAQAVKHKLGSSKPVTSSERRFNGRVPRTDEEIAILLGERPAGWEYLLFASLLVTKLESLDQDYNDHVVGFALPKSFLEAGEVPTFSSREIAKMLATVNAFERLLLGPAQTKAFGEPGEAGNPVLIDHLASSLVATYAELLRWGQNLRSHATPAKQASAVLYAMSDYATQPIEAIRRFVYDQRDALDGMTERISAGEKVDLRMRIHFEVPTESAKRHRNALKKLKKYLGL